MRACTIVTVLSFAAAGLAKPWGPDPGYGSGSVGLPTGDGAITLCCAGDFVVPPAVPAATPACVAYNSAIQNCATGQIRFTCPVTRGVLQGCSDPAGTVAAQNLITEVVNLLPNLLNIA